MASFMAGLPPCPENLKPLQHYLKLAKELEAREPIVAYWARYQAVQHGILLDSKSSDAKKFLMALMDVLEKSKKSMPENDAIRTNMVAQAYLESFAIKLFKWADDQDRSGVQNPNVVKAFYQAAVLLDVLEGIMKEQKEPLSEEHERIRKYARWKATYIQKCLRSGEKPISGPIDEQGNPVPTIGTYNNDSKNNIGFGNYADPKPDYPARNNIPPSGSFDPLLNNPALFPGGAKPITSYPDLNDRGGNNNISRGTPSPPPRVNQSRDSINNPNINNMSKSMYASYPASGGGAGTPSTTYPSSPAMAAPATYTSGGGVASSAGSSLNPDLMNKAQKLVKYAGSSLTYDDTPSAINFLEKALTMLRTGRDVD